MLKVERSNRFKKDVNLMIKRGKKIQKLKDIVYNLAQQKTLALRHFDHALLGNFNYARECHIEPDWLLIYTPSKEVIRLERTGTHSDLFK